MNDDTETGRCLALLAWISRRLPHAPLSPLLAAVSLTLGLAAPANAAVTIDSAKIVAGKLVVSGTSSTGTKIKLDGKFNALIDANDNFAFSLTYLPPDCIVDLLVVGETVSTPAVVAFCGPKGINPRGAWSLTAAYDIDDVVTNQGSSWRAIAPNTGKSPTLATPEWERFVARGETGQAGPQGLQGLQGVTGLQGVAGVIGPIGPKGDTGNTGPAGAKGDTGNTGPAGPAGAKGDTGNTGQAGPQGPIGATGASGPSGPIGSQGPAGPAGNTGATGPQGPIGSQGAQGPQGQTGATGPQGPAGRPGLWLWGDMSSSTFGNDPSSGVFYVSPAVTSPIDGYAVMRANGTCEMKSTGYAALTLKIRPSTVGSTVPAVRSMDGKISLPAPNPQAVTQTFQVLQFNATWIVAVQQGQNFAAKLLFERSSPIDASIYCYYNVGIETF